ncbi:MAG TPA: O-antigen ligase family protein [Candidatus Limnocylindria bacterium]
MSARVNYATGAWPTSDQLARRGVGLRFALAICVMGITGAFAASVVVSEGSPYLVAPFFGILAGIALLVWPRSGLYTLFAAALLFEEWGIAGLNPITAQTHFFQNVSGYSAIPLRFSLADILAILALLAWGLRRVVGANPPARMGPVGWPVYAYGALFAVGLVTGIVRGGAWDMSAALAELRGPLFLCITYFLTVNLVRDRDQVQIFMRLLVILTVVKAVEGLFNYVEMINGPVWLEAVTAHEDVVFFDLAVVLAIGAFILGLRGRLAYVLYATLPVIGAVELLTQRRVAFIALAGGIAAIGALLAYVEPRRTAILFGAASAALFLYGIIAWDQQGLLAQPIRAVRSAFDPTSLNARDLSSNWWRELENTNIAYTLKQLPLTGVGLGQQYFFLREPPELTNFIYWRYMTHDAVLWVWLKAGILGFLAFWTWVAGSAIAGARLFRALPTPDLKLIAAVPVVLVVIQVIFSSVDLGLTYSRNMIVLGVALGLTAYLAQFVADMPARDRVA